MENQLPANRLKFDSTSDDRYEKSSQPEIVSESDLLTTIDRVFLAGANTQSPDDVFENVPTQFP